MPPVSTYVPPRARPARVLRRIRLQKSREFEAARNRLITVGQRVLSAHFAAEGRRVQQVFRISGAGAAEQVPGEGVVSLSKILNRIWKQAFIEFGTRLAEEWDGTILPIQKAVQRPPRGRKSQEWLYDPWPSFIETIVREFVGQRVTNVTQATKDAIAGVVRRSLLENMSIDETANEIRNLYVGFSNHRAWRIARTETVSASNYGQFESAKANPILGLKYWISPMDPPRAREDHMSISIETTAAPIPIEARFSNNLLYPGEPGAPANQVVHCRCALGYLPREEDSQP